MNSFVSSSSDEEYNPNAKVYGRDRPKRIPRPRRSTNVLMYDYSTREAENVYGAASASTSTETSTLDDFDDKPMGNLNRETSQKGKKGSKKSSSSAPPKAAYDGKGRHVLTGVDLCDCLNVGCQGCFFPCPKCKSQKCGTTCRVFRKHMVESLEYQGYDKIVKNPLLRRN